MAEERSPAGRRRPVAKAKAKAKAPVAKPAKAVKAVKAAKAKPAPKPKAKPEPLLRPPPRPPFGGTLGSVIGRPPIGGGILTEPVIARPPVVVAQPVTGIGGTIRIPGAATGAVDTPAPSVTLPPMVRPVFVPDTASFISRIRPNIWELPIFRPSKTVVVSQSPMPGDVVPMGTPIMVTTTVKQLMPLSGLQVSQTLVERFRTAGAVEDLVAAAPPEVQTAVVNQIEYTQLGQAERVAVDQFLNDNVPEAANLDETGRAQLFGDLAFVARI